MIYFDNAATTYPKPKAVYDYVDYVNRNEAVNSGRGSYKASKRATEIIDNTRMLTAKLFNCSNEQIIFTPSATIALNQIIYGLTYDSYSNIYVSPFEHNSVLRPLKLLQKKYGFTINVLPFDSEAQEMQEDLMRQMFAEHNPDYVFMTHISNVTGNILPISVIAQAAKKYNAVCVADCSQSAGLLNVSLCNIDFAVFAGHKTMYGIFGCGGYVNNSNISLLPIIVGGTGSDSLNLEMPDNAIVRYEAASHNIVAIAGLNAALKWILQIGQTDILKHEKEITEYLISRLSDIPGIILYLPKCRDNHIGIVSFNINGYLADELGVILDQDFDIAVRCGYHCAALLHDLIKIDRFKGTVRVSVGYYTTKENVDELIAALEDL